MNFARMMIMALVACSAFWSAVMYGAYYFGYEEGKAFQKYANANVLNNCNTIIAGGLNANTDN